MSTGIHGYGAIFKLYTADTALTNATTLGNISSISGPNQSRDSIDISTLASGTITKEYVPGMVDPGEMTFELNYNETNAAVVTNSTVGLNKHYPIYFAIDLPDPTSTSPGTTLGSSFSGQGFIASLGHALDTGSKISQSITLKLTGPLTYSTAAAAVSP
jgi:hypothetical protein